MMDRYCEFCVNVRSVVYCKADAAYLCLSCDNKVHSANPLSKRHHRTLICDTCRRRPTYVRCYDHHKFMCQACDLSQHNASSHHHKSVINSYVGCPSAQDLGILWGFELNRFVDGSTSSILNPNFGSNSSASLETHVHIKEMDVGIQAFYVLQQLVDLLRVQTTDIDHIPNIIRFYEHKVENDINQVSQQLLLNEGRSNEKDKTLDSSVSPFAQLDPLESKTDETDIQEDSFWQCKSQVPSDQLWSQNMQDLGVCEEPSCLDDLNIPDLDLTFRNFEDLFRFEQDPKRVHQDTFISTSSAKKPRYTSEIMSCSHSSLGIESNGRLCIENEISQSCESMEHHESLTLGGKKKVYMKDSKQGQCGYRKARSDTRKRTKSLSWKFQSHDSITRSC